MTLDLTDDEKLALVQFLGLNRLGGSARRQWARTSRFRQPGAWRERFARTKEQFGDAFLQPVLSALLPLYDPKVEGRTRPTAKR
jgi:hypothetical protein